MEDYQEALDVMKEYEDILKTNKKHICFAYQQGKVFRNFKGNRKIKFMLNNLKYLRVQSYLK